MNCPVCKSESRKWRIRFDYTVLRCTRTDCRHGFVYPTPSAEVLRQYYSSTSDQLANSNSWTMAQDYEVNPKGAMKFYERARLKYLRSNELLSGTQMSIVDVGSSTGVFLRVLSDLGFRNVLGQEVSAEQRAYATSQLGINCVSNLDEISDESADLVTAYAVLEHVPDFAETMDQIYRILKRGGRLVIDVPNSSSFYEKIARNNWMWLIPPAHLNYFTFASLSRSLVRAGFSFESRRTMSTSSQLFIAVFHFRKALGLGPPSTSLSSSWIRKRLFWLAEIIFRALIFPVSAASQKLNQGNQLIFIAAK